MLELQSAILDNNELDLVFLNKASPFLKYQVAMEGKVLYEKEEDAFVEFSIRAVKEYEDVRHFEKYYKEIVEDYLQRSN